MQPRPYIEQKSMTTGREAKQAMVRANMRMVISIARKYDHLGVPLTDLIQEGSLGLVRAVEKFDPERGFKLSTYSAWWIQQAVFKVSGLERGTRGAGCFCGERSGCSGKILVRLKGRPCESVRN